MKLNFLTILSLVAAEAHPSSPSNHSKSPLTIDWLTENQWHDNRFAATSFCPLGNVDMFLPVSASSMPLLTFLVSSVSQFVPCFGTLHVFVDESDFSSLLLWLSAFNLKSTVSATSGSTLLENSDEKLKSLNRFNIKAHAFPKPISQEILNHDANSGGYILQAYLMHWADNYTTPTAEFVMFLDADVAFAMPLTCSSIFDKNGRVYQPSWTIGVQSHFHGPCAFWLNESCGRSYMSILPFTMPIKALPALREKMVATYLLRHPVPDDQATALMTFDHVFNEYCRAHSKRTKSRMPYEFYSQFVVMGVFMWRHRPWEVHQVFCLHAEPGGEGIQFQKHADAEECIDFVPPALHYGWPYHLTNASIPSLSFHHWRRHSHVGEFHHFSDKFSNTAVHELRRLLKKGVCLMAGPLSSKNQDGTALPPFCDPEDLQRTLHPNLDLYRGIRELNWTHVEQVYGYASDEEFYQQKKFCSKGREQARKGVISPLQ